MSARALNNSVLLLLALAMAAVATAAIAPALPRLADIPWTRHAADTHIKQAWNTVTIYERLNSKACKPILAYACPAKMIVMCPIDDPEDLWTGMVIGTNGDNPVVVTAYAAPQSYWFSQVEGCLPTSYVP